MPLTFIDIERQKTWRIAVFFAVLLLLYLAVIAVLGAAFLPVPLDAAPRFWTFAVLAALLVSGIHFWFSASDTVNTVLRSLDAAPPDPEDSIHRTFANIIEEVHIVTANRRTIRSAVIPSLSLNALAAVDLKGNALIAVTEGLLSRLSRPQLEAVVAHEAHHVLSGDCLETTVAASLFGSLSSIVEKLRYTSHNRGLVLPVFLLAWLLLQVGNVLNLFISREREYRADAASVRMSRNPLALAEALHLLSRSWRGAGFIGSGFQMLCIVNPQATALDEAEGFVADLLSTHPPLRRRIELLLDMARVPLGELDGRMRAKTAAPAAGSPGPAYRALSPAQQWEGPFSATELAALPWLGPLTWIRGGDGAAADRAWKDPAINAIFLARLAEQERTDAGIACPSCRQPLIVEPYEGTQTFRCVFCAGTLVRTALLPRIIARTGRKGPCSGRIKALARTVLQENRARRVHRAVSRHAVPALPCPKCSNPMYRGFYSLGYLVEVDRCSNCGITWFDRDELQILQCMIEHRLVPESANVPEGSLAIEVVEGK